MPAILTFFPVGNGDMTLVRLSDADQSTLLIDANIRAAADDPKDATRDVAADLRSRLKCNLQGRPYVDAFLLSHPDMDHCSGLSKHFHLGSPTDYPDDGKPEAERKIVINQIWSSPLIFRRECKTHTLCDDAIAFNAEAKRRVRLNRDRNFTGIEEGNRILIMGEDEGGKTDGLTAILIKAGSTFHGVNGKAADYLQTKLLAPRLQESEDEEEILSKNHSSVVVNLTIAASIEQKNGCKFLTGGDAEVAIWERLRMRYKDDVEALTYDLLQTPHHCSWHSLSYDSWSAMGENAQVSPGARSALSQARKGAYIVASSRAIINDDCDPPCIRAKREYQSIVDAAGGSFYCTGEYPNSGAPEPLEFEITPYGPSKLLRAGSTVVIASSKPPRAG